MGDSVFGIFTINTHKHYLLFVCNSNLTVFRLLSTTAWKSLSFASTTTSALLFNTQKKNEQTYSQVVLT